MNVVRVLLLDVRGEFSSRGNWVWAGDAAQWLCAAAMAWYIWLHGVTFVTFAVASLVCLVCQAAAVAAVAWPGPGAFEDDDLHQGVTVGVLCLSWIAGVIPGVAVLPQVVHDPHDHLVMGVFLAGLVLTTTSVAGLMTVVSLRDRVAATTRRDRLRDWAEDGSDAGGCDGGDGGADY